MALYQLMVLSLIQGLSEFLPISSSGHLILMPKLFHWQDQGLALDVALHLGTLGAVVLYFRKDLGLLIKSIYLMLMGRPIVDYQKVIYLIVATLPAVAVGAVLSYIDLSGMRSLHFIGWTTLLFGIVLYITDTKCASTKLLQDLSILQALLIGVAQTLAFIPGTSRSGICITAGRLLQLTRTEATRFAFILSIPVITGAVVMTAFKMHKIHQSFFTPDAFIAIVLSFGIGLITISFILKWLQRYSFKPFVIYRIILGIGLIGYSCL